MSSLLPREEFPPGLDRGDFVPLGVMEFLRTTPKALRVAFDRAFWQRLASTVDIEQDDATRQ